MKLKGIIVVAAVVLTMAIGVAQAAVGYHSFTLTFTTTTNFTSIVSDTASVTNPQYARLYVFSNTSNVNSVWRATKSGAVVTPNYYDRVISYRAMYYNTGASIPQGSYVTLQGRPDSSVSSCTVSGEFGAG